MPTMEDVTSPKYGRMSLVNRNIDYFLVDTLLMTVEERW